MIRIALLLIGGVLVGCGADTPLAPGTDPVDPPDTTPASAIRFVYVDVLYPGGGWTTAWVKVTNEGGDGYFKVRFFQLDSLLRETSRRALASMAVDSAYWLVSYDSVNVTRVDALQESGTSDWVLADRWPKIEG